MKKICLLLLMLTMLFMLVACNGEETAAYSAVESMLVAMASEDYEKAETLIHPGGLERDSLFDDDWGTMCTYLKDSEIKKLKWLEYTTYGDENSDDFEESGILEATMRDGLTYKVEYTYVIKDGDAGFTDFHLNHKK